MAAARDGEPKSLMISDTVTHGSERPIWTAVAEQRWKFPYDAPKGG